MDTREYQERRQHQEWERQGERQRHETERQQWQQQREENTNNYQATEESGDASTNHSPSSSQSPPFDPNNIRLTRLIGGGAVK
ncbi:uncharacterized protein ACHE_50259A [Aspergillus chevalieri]|uniref:Uncharacterized protein n=1 Tax=Aspergillus chevalieri TaxID=182096 RepID=A0A7R7ZPT8_ASPCH|nr:uncharacterized protein ACHE_50259A [Aspergillus chevalieri]BCR89061.1 hypothetical protein ACHE_50259A [Aspergillus chevalieri]